MKAPHALGGASPISPREKSAPHSPAASGRQTAPAEAWGAEKSSFWSGDDRGKELDALRDLPDSELMADPLFEKLQGALAAPVSNAEGGDSSYTPVALPPFTGATLAEITRKAIPRREFPDNDAFALAASRLNDAFTGFVMRKRLNEERPARGAVNKWHDDLQKWIKNGDALFGGGEHDALRLLHDAWPVEGEVVEPADKDAEPEPAANERSFQLRSTLVRLHGSAATNHHAATRRLVADTRDVLFALRLLSNGLPGVTQLLRTRAISPSARNRLMEELSAVYGDLTGQRPKVSVGGPFSAEEGKTSGPAVRWFRGVFQSASTDRPDVAEFAQLVEWAGMDFWGRKEIPS